MKTVKIHPKCKKMLSDLYTPIGIYLRIRDKFPNSILMESGDHNAQENSFSYIGIHPVAGIEVRKDELEYKYPTKKEQVEPLKNPDEVPERLMRFIQSFEIVGSNPLTTSQNFFGYTAYEALHFFGPTKLHSAALDNPEIPLLRYRLYQYVIAIDHFKNELYLCENGIEGLESNLEEIETLIRIKDCPTFPFKAGEKEKSNLSDEEFRKIVQIGIDHCKAGEIDQIVFSRSFQQDFTGDDFNVYRALRSINPSPYLFYFDYGDYRLIGSSPESQLIVRNRKAIIHPIAGTIKRTGNQEEDEKAIDRLKKDPKENAEHDMLVDLATKEMGSFAENVQIAAYREIKIYSHVIHLVSEIIGALPESFNPFELLSKSFPAGTLSGAPKEKALNLIHKHEPNGRGFYAGCIGAVGINGDFNHAIMIRSFLSKNNQLRYQAGAGVIDQSKPESELQEVNNKLRALKKALKMANTL